MAVFVSSTRSIIQSIKNKKIKLIESDKSHRAYQLNLGGRSASSEKLFFLFADTIPPKNFTEEILQVLNGNNEIAGCFRLKTEWNHWFLKFNTWFSRFDINIFRYGDQGLYLSKILFKEIGGYREDLMIMEDYDIVVRLKKKRDFIISQNSVITSDRSYKKIGPYKIFILYYFIAISYIIGVPQDFLYRLYRKFN